MPGLYVNTKNEEVHIVVAKRGGLKKWFKERWVNIGAPKKNGKFQPCGRSKAKKGSKGYPKCVPLSKANSMTKAQIKSAVRRKRAKAQGVRGKPTNVKTFTKRGRRARKKS